MPPPRSSVNAVYFPSATLGIAVGLAASSAATQPTILASFDGAATWMVRKISLA